MADPFQKLKDEHEVFVEMIADLEKAPDMGRLKEMTIEIKAHSRGEERSIYKAMMDDDELKHHALEGTEEHRLVAIELDDMASMDLRGDEFKARLKVLKDLLENHIKEEEEEVFPKMKEMFDNDVLVKLVKSYEMIEESIESKAE